MKQRAHGWWIKMLNLVKQSASEVIRLPKAKRQVLLTILEAKRQEKMFIRLLLRLKIIKEGNNDAFLGEGATKKYGYCF